MASIEEREAASDELVRLEEAIAQAVTHRDRAVADRDRVARELAQRRTVAPVPKRAAVARVEPSGPLSTGERAALVVEVRSAARATFRTAIPGLFLALVGVAFAVVIAVFDYTDRSSRYDIGTLAIAVFCMVGVAVQLAVLMRTRRARWEPVVDALRDAPERIARIDHRKVPTRERVTAALAVETFREEISIHSGSHELVARTGDLRSLHRRLQRHCKQATFGGELAQLPDEVRR